MENKVTVHFTRQFHAGNLRGLSHKDKVSFPNVRTAKDWVDNLNGRKLEYATIFVDSIIDNS